MSRPTSRSVPTFSSPLADALARFLAFKRAGGCRYHDEARALRVLDQFLITAVNPADPVITLDVVRRYVARRGEESETTRAHRLSLIRQVCRFLALEQPRTTVPAPRFLGIRRRTFVARVMSQEEDQRFLAGCEHLVTRSWSPIRDTVLGTPWSSCTSPDCGRVRYSGSPSPTSTSRAPCCASATPRSASRVWSPSRRMSRHALTVAARRSSATSARARPTHHSFRRRPAAATLTPRSPPRSTKCSRGRPSLAAAPAAHSGFTISVTASRS